MMIHPRNPGFGRGVRVAFVVSALLWIGVVLAVLGARRMGWVP